MPGTKLALNEVQKYLYDDRIDSNVPIINAGIPIIQGNAPKKAVPSEKNVIPFGFVYKEPKSRFHSEVNPEKTQLYDATGQRIQKEERFISPADIPYLGFMPAGEEKTKNPFKRWANKVGKAWKVYTDFGNPIEMWKPLAAQTGANILGFIESGMPIPEERHGFENVSGAFVTMLRTDLGLYSHNAPYQIMPALRRHLSAAEGASDLKYLYTYDKPGDPKEYVIYLSGGEIPDDTLLIDHKNYVDLHGISPYEDPNLPFRNRIQELFDRKDGPPALNIATLFDYSDYFADEPDRAHRWAVKDDSWLANQYGSRNPAMEAALPPALAGLVKVYERPVNTTGFWYNLGALLGDKSPRSGRMWVEWVVKKPLIYIPTDLILEPIEMALEGRLPPEVMRSIVFEKAKGVAAAWRGFSNPRPHYLWYGEYSP